MRYIFLLLLIYLFASQNLPAQSIKFETGTWEEVQEKARATDRLIFLDVYTSWCKPCKWMEEKVFTDSAVADYFNHHFVNYRVDAEKSVGRLLASKYHVDRYPTMLFTEASTKEIYNIVGYMDASEFLREAKKATDPMALKRLRVYQRKFQGGVRDKRFLNKYLKLLTYDYKKTDVAVFNAWFAQLTLPDFLDSSIIKLLLLTIPNAQTRAYSVALDQYHPDSLAISPLYRDSAELNRIHHRMHEALDKSFKLTMANGDEGLFNKLKTYKKTLVLIEQDSIPKGFNHEMDMLTLQFYRKNKKVIPFYNLANKLVNSEILHSYKARIEIDTLKDDTLTVYDFNFFIDSTKYSKQEAGDILFEAASGILELSHDMTQLHKAIAWSHAALKLNKDSKYYPVLAKLLLKSGKPEEAISTLRGAHQGFKGSENDRALMRDALMEIYNLQRNKPK